MYRLIRSIAAYDSGRVMLATLAAAASIGGNAIVSYARSRTVAMLGEHARHVVDRRLVELV